MILIRCDTCGKELDERTDEHVRIMAEPIIPRNPGNPDDWRTVHSCIQCMGANLLTPRPGQRLTYSRHLPFGKKYGEA